MSFQSLTAANSESRRMPERHGKKASKGTPALVSLLFATRRLTLEWIVQGQASNKLTSRDNLLRSIHTAVHELREAENNVETWRRQSSVPAESALVTALQRANNTKQSALQVTHTRQKLWTPCLSIILTCPAEPTQATSSLVTLPGAEHACQKSLDVNA